MSIFESVILGIVQGLTEFIPVSSSGHEVILQNAFSGASDHMFLEFINIGTLLALLVCFWKRIVRILTDVFKNHNFRLARNIILTSIPAGIVGYLLSDFIDSAPFFGSVITVACALSAIGLIMIFLEKLPHGSPVKSGEALTALQALAIGGAQILALIPGVSRSGSTIIMGKLTGLPGKQAAEYSFLASIPIMLGVTFKVLIKDHDYMLTNLPVVAASNVVAFVVGMFAIGFMLRYLAKHDLKVFGYYRIIIAVITLIIAFSARSA